MASVALCAIKQPHLAALLSHEGRQLITDVRAPPHCLGFHRKLSLNMGLTRVRSIATCGAWSMSSM